MKGKGMKTNLNIGFIFLLIFCVPAISLAAAFTGLGDLPGGSYESRPYAISGDGSTVVGYSRDDGGKRAFIWTADEGMVSLGTLGGSSQAHGVSDDGSVVVGYSYCPNGSYYYVGFRWTADEGMIRLDDRDTGIHPGWAYGVSGDGSTIVGWGLEGGNPAGLFHAFRWTEEEGAVSVGGIPGGSRGPERQRCLFGRFSNCRRHLLSFLYCAI